MTTRQRFLAVLNGGVPDDHLPLFEWASWWEVTTNRWLEEGLPQGFDNYELGKYFGNDGHKQYWFPHLTSERPSPAYHGAPLIEDEKDYEAFRKYLFPKDAVTRYLSDMEKFRELQNSGETAVWVTLEGYFWFPRTLFGIENHLFSFYDQPELYHRICNDLCQWQLGIIEELCKIITPDFMTIAEDMSFNGGPMLSEEMFNEFVKPYYERIIPALKKHGIKVFVDTDGDVTKLIPWLQEAGVEGIGPLERQAGVDVNEIRRQYPSLLMFGGFNKLVMSKGKEAVRNEFERLLPAMKSGGFLVSVDHQTPPDVSLDQYRQYLALLKEYSILAVK